MSEFKNVLKHLNKEEVKLSSEKVELASIKELKDLSKKVNSEHDKVLSIHDKFEAIKDELLKANDSLIKISASANQALSDFRKKADELGLDGSKVKEYQDLLSEKESASETHNDIKKVVK